MKNVILISIISIFGVLFYSCDAVYKTVTVYSVDSVTGKTVKKVTKYYDTTARYNTYVNPYPYPYYYANPYWYGGWYSPWGYNNNVIIVRPNQSSPQPRPVPQPIRPSVGYPRHIRGR
jgi:hypothetical protein